MGRPRSARNRALPPNLYQRSGYFAWRDPRDGKEYGLGRDKPSAIEQAIEANLHVSGQASAHRLVDRLTGVAGRTFGDWVENYYQILQRRGLKATSLRSVIDQLRAALDAWADKPLVRIDVLMVNALLQGWVDQDKLRMALHVKSRLSDLFREAQAAGWIDHNPAAITKVHGVRTQRARLSFEQLEQILKESAADKHRQWAVSAFKLAIATGQRRNDLARLTRADIADGHLHIEQEKTGTRLRLPLALTLPELGQSLGEIIDECLASGVIAPDTIIHHRAFAGIIKPGNALRPELLTRAFAEHRDRAGLGGEHPATFHELRSLSGRLYAAAYGKDFAQAVLGHKTAATTAVYLDVRGSAWITIPQP